MQYEIYENADVYVNCNIGNSKGFDIQKTFDEMQEKMKKIECNILVKTSRRWYIKRGLYEHTANFLRFNQRKNFYPNITTYLFKNDFSESSYKYY
jgi:hypothetical protein